jgi:hypothetical protein
MTRRYNTRRAIRPLKSRFQFSNVLFELFGRDRFWWVTCVLSYKLWNLGVSIAPPHPSALATEWLAVLTAPKSLSYCTTFPTLTVHMVEYIIWDISRALLGLCCTRAAVRPRLLYSRTVLGLLATQALLYSGCTRTRTTAVLGERCSQSERRIGRSAVLLAG